MLDANLEYQLCLFFLFILGLVAILLLPTHDDRRRERHRPTHDTTKTRRMS
jgi:hypothetical protein